MHRNLLISLLEAYIPTQEEIKYKADTLSFVKANKNCFERSLESGHITASAWLLNKDQSKALLMHHAKLNIWVQLGGHCDGDPNVLGVAVKEAQEESGIQHIVPLSKEIFDIDVHRIPANSREKEHYHYDIRFLLAVVSDEDVVKNNESKAVVWIDKQRNSLPTKERSVVRMFNKWTTL